jgi:hypothetical protein
VNTGEDKKVAGVTGGIEDMCVDMQYLGRETEIRLAPQREGESIK